MSLQVRVSRLLSYFPQLLHNLQLHGQCVVTAKQPQALYKTVSVNEENPPYQYMSTKPYTLAR